MKDTEVIAYSPRQAAEISSLSLRTVMTAIASGELRSVKKGRRRLIFSADLESYLRSAQHAPSMPGIDLDADAGDHDTAPRRLERG